MNNQFVPCDNQTLVRQIGLGNILAISGGRIGKRETGVTLPVSNGYSVTVDLAGNDTYTVRRVFTRAGKVTIKGEVTDVYCDQVGEIAYQAHAFRSYEFPRNPYKVIERSTGDLIETHETEESANKAVQEINNRWGAEEVFVQKQ